MTLYNTFYHTLVLTGAFLSFRAFKRGHRRFGFLAVLLLITSVIELITLYFQEHNINFFWLYNSYSILEYPLFAAFLLKGLKNKPVCRIVLLSIGVYIITSLTVSTLVYHFLEFPSININFEAFLLSILCTYILFNLDVADDKSITRTPDFWICSGILVYFGTSFFFNAVYVKISDLDRESILLLYNYIARPLNVTLYSFMIIGTLCLPIRRKNTLQ